MHKIIFSFLCSLVLVSCGGGANISQSAQPQEWVCKPMFKFRDSTIKDSDFIKSNLEIKEYPPLRNTAYTSELGDSMISKTLLRLNYYNEVSFDREELKYDDSRSITEKSILTNEELSHATIVSEKFCPPKPLENLQDLDLEILEKLSNKSPLTSAFYYDINKLVLSSPIVVNKLVKGDVTIYKVPSLTGDDIKKSFTFRANRNSGQVSWKNINNISGFLIHKQHPGIVFLITDDKLFNVSWSFTGFDLKELLPVRMNVVQDKENYISTRANEELDFFDRTLIYNGRSGDEVKFLYREFSGSTNRQAFQQEVTYDLKIGEIIGFKGARFKIIEADNIGIKYEVIETF